MPSPKKNWIARAAGKNATTKQARWWCDVQGQGVNVNTIPDANLWQLTAIVVSMCFNWQALEKVFGTPWKNCLAPASRHFKLWTCLEKVSGCLCKLKMPPPPDLKNNKDAGVLVRMLLLGRKHELQKFYLQLPPHSCCISFKPCLPMCLSCPHTLRLISPCPTCLACPHTCHLHTPFRQIMWPEKTWRWIRWQKFGPTCLFGIATIHSLHALPLSAYKTS